MHGLKPQAQAHAPPGCGANGTAAAASLYSLNSSHDEYNGALRETAEII
jgi:hypothetical protein